MKELVLNVDCIDWMSRGHCQFAGWLRNRSSRACSPRNRMCGVSAFSSGKSSPSVTIIYYSLYYSSFIPFCLKLSYNLFIPFFQIIICNYYVLFIIHYLFYLIQFIALIYLIIFYYSFLTWITFIISSSNNSIIIELSYHLFMQFFQIIIFNYYVLFIIH